MLGLYDQPYDSLAIFQTAKVDWISAWPWGSDDVKVSLTNAEGQDVLVFSPADTESNHDFAARVAANLNDRRFGRSGD